MRIEYKSRTGHFNFCNPDEESISCNIAIYDNEGNRLKNTNCSPEYEYDGNNIDEVIEMLETADKKVLYSSYQKDWKEMLEFIKQNREEIEKGNIEYRLNQIDKQISKLQEEKDRLTPLAQSPRNN